MGQRITHRERILNFLNKNRGRSFCDDCIASELGIPYRQTVNSICRRLDKEGVIKREKGRCSLCGKYKITNTMRAIVDQEDEELGKLYKLLCNFESVLRDFIREELSRVTDKWWDERIPVSYTHLTLPTTERV